MILKKIGVIGGGTMGQGITEMLAARGHYRQQHVYFKLNGARR